MGLFSAIKKIVNAVWHSEPITEIRHQVEEDVVGGVTDAILDPTTERLWAAWCERREKFTQEIAMGAYNSLTAALFAMDLWVRKVLGKEVGSE